jgi:tetratricopeptide (TPR) repeat protein
MSTSFAAFQKDWTKYMKSRKVENRPGLLPRRLVFKTDTRAGKDEPDPAESAASEGLSKDAKKYFRLGQLLLEQGKSRAAVVELEKARKLAGGYELGLPMKLARAYLAAGAYASAEKTADEVSELYPEYVGGWLIAGRAMLARGDNAGAKERLLEAVRLNPFDPDAHRDLARALSALGDTAGAERERKAAELVEG